MGKLIRVVELARDQGHRGPVSAVRSVLNVLSKRRGGRIPKDELAKRAGVSREHLDPIIRELSSRGTVVDLDRYVEVV